MHSHVRIRWRHLVLAVALGGALAQAAADALARARTAYNAGRFDEAIAAARDGMRVPAASNAAAVVLARAHLERYRTAGESADLEGARAALAQVRPDLLTPRDRVEFLMAQGVSLFVDGCGGGCFSAAAEFFGMAIDAGVVDIAADRDAMFEWWAGALDRQAELSRDAERASIYRRILDRAETERANAMVPNGDPQPTLAMLTRQWEEIKGKYL